MAKLKAAIITDIHYGFDERDKLGSQAPKLMNDFAKTVNKHKPDCIIDMGDRISFKDKKTDRKYMKELKAHFNKISAPLYSVIGNHDFRYLSLQDNEDIMGNPSASYTKNIGGYHLIFWNPEAKYSAAHGIEIKNKSIKWLQKTLAKTIKPAILFSHVPLDNLGNEGHSEDSKKFFWSQGSKIRKVMEESGKIVLCMGGHRHRERHREINGIHYITQQAFTKQLEDNSTIPSRTFSFLEAKNGKLTVKMQGELKKTYKLEPLI